MAEKSEIVLNRNNTVVNALFVVTLGQIGLRCQSTTDDGKRIRLIVATDSWADQQSPY